MEIPSLKEMLDRIVIQRGGGTYEFDKENPKQLKLHYPLERVGKDQRFYSYNTNVASPNFPMNLDWKGGDKVDDNLVQPDEYGILKAAAEEYVSGLGRKPKPVEPLISERPVDSRGSKFDPDRHESDAEGNPVLNNNKTFKLKA